MCVALALADYSTAQLQGNTRMCLECVQDASGTRVRYIRNAHETRLEHPRDASVQAQNLAARFN